MRAPALADHILTALQDRTACLPQNHGTLAYAPTLDRAFTDTAQLEWMCHLWLTAASVPGHTPSLLTPDQVREAGDKLKGYGQGTA